MNRIHPFQAYLIAIGAFFLSSIGFNLITIFLFMVHLGQLLGWLITGVVLFAMFFFTMPLWYSAQRARSHKRAIVIYAATTLCALFLFAYSYNLDFLLYTIFPHWPAWPKYVHSPMAVGGIIFLWLLYGGFSVIGVLAMNDTPSEPDLETNFELAGDAAEGVLDGLKERGHEHVSSWTDHLHIH